MNKDIFQGKWNEVKGQVKEKWGNLTDDDLSKVNGRRDQLLGVLQQRYGYAKDKAEKELKNFESTFHSSHIGRENDTYNERETDFVNEFTEEKEEPKHSIHRKTGTEDL